MRIQADRTVCIASGNCVLRCPEVFDQNQDALVTLLTDTPPAAQGERVRDAVAGCPSGALSLVED